MKKLFTALTAAVATISIQVSCDRHVSPYDEDPDYGAKKFLAEYCIDTLYYWNDEVRQKNSSVKLTSWSVDTLFDKLLYSGDRWSWMEDGESFEESQTGVVSNTWGLSLGQALDANFCDESGEQVLDSRAYQLRVRYIYPGSPLEAAGVTRGAILKGIGGEKDNLVIFDETAQKQYVYGIATSPQTFTFHLTDGRDTTFTTSWASSLSTSPVHLTKVFTSEDFEGLEESVGYLNYLQFKGTPFLDELREAFGTIGEAGVKTLIIDLRYNTGGYSTATQLMMDCLATKEMAGLEYESYRYNKLLSSHNESLYIAEGTDSGLTGIYIICGSYSASASEVIINSLKPYFGDNLHLVGHQTYGKPNGMLVCLYPQDAETYGDLDYVFYPICFYNYNSAGETIPDEGFTPDNARPDDLFSDWGVNEDLTYACLYHIVHGEYPAAKVIPASASTKSSSGPKSLKTVSDDLSFKDGGYKVLP